MEALSSSCSVASVLRLPLNYLSNYLRQTRAAQQAGVVLGKTMLIVREIVSMAGKALFSGALTLDERIAAIER